MKREILIFAVILAVLGIAWLNGNSEILTIGDALQKFEDYSLIGGKTEARKIEVEKRKK